MPKTANYLDYYDVLDVPKNATNLQIREAYVRLKQTYDGRNQALYSLCSEEEAQEMRSQVEQAYSVLQDEGKRREYNLSQEGPATPSYLEKDSHSGFRSHETPMAQPEFGYRSVSSIRPVKAKKIHAPGSRDEGLQEKLAEIVAAGDPGDGALLRRLREASGVSDLQMHESTKIGIDHIRAIESNTFELLPKGIFVKGFLRSYLKYLLVPDIEVFVSAFVERLETARMPQSDL